MILFLNLILVFYIIIGLMLAGRIYRLDKKNFLYQLTSVAVLCCTGLTFLEYEISRQTFIGSVLKLDPVHTILSSLTVFLCVCSVWTFTQPFDKKKNPRLNIILTGTSLFVIGIIWVAILIGPYRVTSGVEYSGLLWQYIIRSDGIGIKLFTFWYVCQIVAINFSFWCLYKKAEAGKERYWKLVLFSTMLGITSIMFVVFMFRGAEVQKGFYYMGPWIMTCCCFLAYAYSNFKLFAASPLNALDNILESMSNLMVIADTDFNVSYFNQATREELGFHNQQIPKMTFHDIARTFHVNKWESDVKKITTLKRKEKYAREFELSYKTYQFNYHMTFSPIFNEHKIKTGYLVIATNITKIKKVEYQLKKYAAELEQSNRELERFAYIASHDLKTPLRNVNSFLNLIQRRIKKYNDAEIEEFLQFAINSAGQMYHLIQDVLEYSTLNAESALKSQRVDLNNVIINVCQTLSAAIEEKQAVVYSEPLPIILSDELRMIQLFQNMIENGLKYNVNKRPTIYISYHEGELFHHITFKDNGIGIDEQYTEQIFQMFKRLHRTNEYEGTGIGLAICKKIVMNYGGDITVQSVETQGSQFKVSLKKEMVEV